MATPITNIPQGFISLTGLRDMGGVPREVVPTITPGIDVTEFLLLNRETVAGDVSVAGVSSYVAFSVPAGELWYIHFISAMTDVMAAGDAVGIALGYIYGTSHVTISDPERTAATGHRITVHTKSFWAPSGTGLSVRVLEFAGTAKTTEVRAVVTKLRI
jgi:hypothetical protein